jgi:GT2 family glycosyltransferase
MLASMRLRFSQAAVHLGILAAPFAPPALQRSGGDFQMIAFGCSITDPEMYERCAGRGIELVREPDSPVFAHAATGSLPRNYNILLDQARELGDELEALVLLHQDSEITDPRFCATLREAISDPMVAVVGCVGSIGARSIAWWEGSVTWASFTHRYPESEFGGGEFPAFGWDFGDKPAYARTGEVDNIDGFLIGLTPWAIQNLRFDESLGKSHGYDADLCLQAREAGRKVITADIKVVHHHSLELIGDSEAWVEAHIRVAEKWDGRGLMDRDEAGELDQRARRAEAEAGLMRLKLAAMDLQAKALARQLEGQINDLREHLEGIERSQSWRLTRPLRAMGLRLRRR